MVPNSYLIEPMPPWKTSNLELMKKACTHRHEKNTPCASKLSVRSTTKDAGEGKIAMTGSAIMLLTTLVPTN
ncbi:hypothetical protein FOMPIDRAFT_1050760 [Fomitopsis schrenkii]|uniref:Uncharacterized protein n=1 Tax=Fomitopsis schrenkii TaxID=2126942 RepID=S8E7F6_FOMSC|nr:hypothetical protein FOMPIDRAFT_1050760 [Fomitopsis schrenkii]